MSPEFLNQRKISLDNLQNKETYSQANIFHNVMGAFDISSEVYDTQLDIYSNE